MPTVAAAAITGGVLATTGAVSVGTIAGSAFLGGAVVYGSLAAVSGLVARATAEDIGGIDGQQRHTVRGAILRERWILGRARAAGHLVYYTEESDGDSVHMALDLGAAPMDAVERIWVDGREVEGYDGSDYEEGRDYRFEATDDGGLRRGASLQAPMRIRFSLSGQDGDAGRWLRNRSATHDDGRWSADHRLDGRAWMYVDLYQPHYGDDLDARFWTRLPNIELLLRGLKFAWPGQATPAWTENAAAIYWWLLRHRAGLPATAIDDASARAAIAICDETVASDLPPAYAAYRAASIRYAANGVLYADDDLARVRAEIDYAMQGALVEQSGVVHIRPGADRPTIGTIGEHNIQQPLGFSPEPGLRDRINTASMSLAASREHDWLPLELPTYADAAAVSADGETRHVDLGRRAFVTDPVAAGRLLAVQMRRVRAGATYSYRIVPSPDLSELSWLPGDRVLITDPVRGFTEIAAEIVRISRTPDWLLDVDLVEVGTDTYSDSLVLPPLPVRALDPPTDRTPPRAPAGLTVTPSARIVADGTIRSQLEIAWTTRAGRVRVRATGPGDYSADGIVSGSGVTLDVPAAGEYAVDVRAISPADVVSTAATATATVSWAALAPQVPSVLLSEQRGGNLTMILSTASERDIAGVEARYRRAEIDSTTSLAVIAESDWDSLPRLDVRAVVPALAGQPLQVELAIPQSGLYRIALRTVTRQLLLSPVRDTGHHRLALPIAASGSINFHPDFLGSLDTDMARLAASSDAPALLLLDATPAALTKSAWDGGTGWPWGPSAHTQSYGTRFQIFPTSANRRFSAEATFWSPPGTPALAVNISASARIVGQAGAGGNLLRFGTQQVGADGISPWTVAATVDRAYIDFRLNAGHQGAAVESLTLHWEEVA